MTLLLAKHSGSITRTVAPAVACASRDANHSSRLYPLWSHRSSVAMRCDMMAISRREAWVAITSHMPLLSAATRNARARLRPSAPADGSSTVSRNPCAEGASHPSLMLSTSLSR